MKIKLDHSSITSIEQSNDGLFKITIRGFRKNRLGNYNHYDIEISNVNEYWLTRFLKLSKEKITEYKQTVLSFAEKFGV